MSDQVAIQTEAGRHEGAEHEQGQESGAPVIAADLLVEEVSIDGMCGVY